MRLDGRFIDLGQYIDVTGADKAVEAFREAVFRHVAAARNQPAARAGRMAAAARKSTGLRRRVRELINSDPENDVRFSSEHRAALKEAAREYRERTDGALQHHPSLGTSNR